MIHRRLARVAPAVRSGRRRVSRLVNNLGRMVTKGSKILASGSGDRAVGGGRRRPAGRFAGAAD
jgi:hypothetical protein